MTFGKEIAKVTREHVLLVLKDIHIGAPSYQPSSDYDLLHDGKHYPPKDVLRRAYFYAEFNKRVTSKNDYLSIGRFSGGKPANSALRKLGFKIVLKGSDVPIDSP